MYAYIKGTVVDVTPTHATIETGGIGYFIDIPASTYAHLKVGKEAQLFTAFIVRETAQLSLRVRKSCSRL